MQLCYKHANQLVSAHEKLGVEVSCGCGWLDVLSTALKQYWRWLEVVKRIFNLTALVETAAASMLGKNVASVPLCGDKTADFKAVFYWDHPKAHLCSNHVFNQQFDMPPVRCSLTDFKLYPD